MRSLIIHGELTAPLVDGFAEHGLTSLAILFFCLNVSEALQGSQRASHRSGS